MSDQDMDAAVPALSQAIKKAKKKKKKPKKLTPKQKALEKLEKVADELIKDPVKINKLIQTVSHWLRLNDKVVYKVLNQQSIFSLENEFHKKNQAVFDSDDEDSDGNDLVISTANVISYDDFKTVSVDLGIPCSQLELHVICKLMDPDMEGTIEYKYFTAAKMESFIKHREIDGIRFIKKSEKTTDPKNKCIVFKKELATNFASQYPLYLKIDILLISFANEKKCMNHIRNTLVYSHLKVYELFDLITNKTDIVSNKISIYRELMIESLMDDDRTLESYGFKGGEYNQVLNSHEKCVFFYDYEILDNDDPILNCDFYYHDYKYTPPEKKETARHHRVK